MTAAGRPKTRVSTRTARPCRRRTTSTGSTQGRGLTSACGNRRACGAHTPVAPNTAASFFRAICADALPCDHTLPVSTHHQAPVFAPVCEHKDLPAQELSAQCATRMARRGDVVGMTQVGMTEIPSHHHRGRSRVRQETRTPRCDLTFGSSPSDLRVFSSNRHDEHWAT